MCERERERVEEKKGKRRLLNGRTRCETSRRVATFGCFPLFFPFPPLPLLRKICFHVDATVGGSDTAGRINGGRFRVRAERKGREAFSSRFLGGFGAERSSNPSSTAGEAAFCWKQVGSAESRVCVRPAGGAEGGGGRGRCPRPVFFSPAPPSYPFHPSCGFSSSSSPSCPGALGWILAPFGLSSGELAVRT